MEMNIKMQIENLNKSFTTKQGSLQVIKDVSFDIYDNEFLVILDLEVAVRQPCSRHCQGKCLMIAAISNPIQSKASVLSSRVFPSFPG